VKLIIVTVDGVLIRDEYMPDKCDFVILCLAENFCNVKAYCYRHRSCGSGMLTVVHLAAVARLVDNLTLDQ